MSDEIRLDIQANINPIFQKPLAADPNQTKIKADLELRPVFQKWLNTDLRFKDPLSADIHFTDQSLRQEQTRLQNTVLQTLKDIQIQLRAPSNPAALLKDIDDLFKKTPIKLLDRDTKIDKQAITAYLRRYIAELESTLKQTPPAIQAKLELDINKLRDELRTVQATINVGLEPDTTKLRTSFDAVTQTLADGFSQSVDTLVKSFATKIADELQTPIPLKVDTEKILNDLKNTLAQFQQQAPEFLNASIQAGSQAVSQAQSATPQSPEIFTAQLLALSKELEAAKNLLTAPLLDLVQAIQQQIDQLTSLPEYGQLFDTLVAHVKAAGEAFAHLLPIISNFRSLIENTKQTSKPEIAESTASPAQFAPPSVDSFLAKIKESLKDVGGTGNLKPEFQKYENDEISFQELIDELNKWANDMREDRTQGMMLLPPIKDAVTVIKELNNHLKNQDTPPPSDTPPPPVVVDKPTDKSTEDTTLKDAIVTLNTTLKGFFEKLPRGGSLANPDLFDARIGNDYIGTWTQKNGNSTRLADAIRAGAVPNVTATDYTNVSEKNAAMAISKGVDKSKIFNFDSIRDSIEDLSKIGGDFVKNAEALIKGTIDASEKGTLQAFLEIISAIARSAGIANEDLGKLAAALLNADEHVKAYSGRQDAISEEAKEINSIFEDINAYLSQAKDKLEEWEKATGKAPDAMKEAYKKAIQMQQAFSDTAGDEVQEILRKITDDAAAKTAIEKTAIERGTKEAERKAAEENRPVTNEDIEKEIAKIREKLSGIWETQCRDVIDVLKGKKDSITFFEPENLDREGAKGTTLNKPTISLLDVREEAHKSLDVSLDPEQEKLLKRIKELQDVFGELSATVTGLGGALSGIISTLPQEFQQSIGQLSTEVASVQRNYKQFQDVGKTLGTAGESLANTFKNTSGFIGNYARGLGTAMQSVGPYITRFAGALAGLMVVVKGVQVAFSEMQAYWNARTGNAEQFRQLAARQSADNRLTLQTDLTSLLQSRASSAEKIATSQRQQSQLHAQNTLTSSSDVTRHQERLIQLEEERLRLAEKNAILAKETEQFRNRAEKQLQQAQEQRHQKSQTITQKGWTGSSIIDGQGNVLSKTGAGEATGATTGGIAGGVSGGALGVLGGAIAGAFIGGTLGAFAGPAGIAMGAYVGKWVGGALGGALGAYAGSGGGAKIGGSLGAGLDSTSQQWQDDLRKYSTETWSQERNLSRQKNVQAARDEYNKEVSGLETEKFKQLNANLDEITANIKTFGDVLPIEQFKQFQEAAQQATNANLQYAQTQAALDQFNRTKNMSADQLALESARETKGLFFNYTTFSRSMGKDEFGQEIVITGKTFAEFNEKLRKAEEQLRPILEKRNEAAKKESERRERENAVNDHLAAIGGNAATATRIALEAMAKAAADFAAHMDNFRLQAAKDATSTLRTQRTSLESGATSANAYRETWENQLLENRFLAQNASIAHLDGDRKQQVAIAQEELRAKVAEHNRAMEDQAYLSDLKVKQAIDLFQLAKNNEGKLHQVRLDAELALNNLARSNAERLQQVKFAGEEAYARARNATVASGRGPTLESRRTEDLARFRAAREYAQERRIAERTQEDQEKTLNPLIKKQAAEQAAHEETLLKRRQEFEFKSEQRRREFEIGLVQLQHDLRMEAIKEECEFRRKYEEGIANIKQEIADSSREQVQAARDKARAAGDTRFDNKSDYEVKLMLDNDDIAALKAYQTSLRSHISEGNDQKALDEFDTQVKEAGNSVGKLAALLQEQATKHGYKPEETATAASAEVEVARKTLEEAKRSEENFKEDLAKQEARIKAAMIKILEYNVLPKNATRKDFEELATKKIQDNILSEKQKEKYYNLLSALTAQKTVTGLLEETSKQVTTAASNLKEKEKANDLQVARRTAEIGLVKNVDQYVKVDSDRDRLATGSAELVDSLLSPKLSDEADNVIKKAIEEAKKLGETYAKVNETLDTSGATQDDKNAAKSEYDTNLAKVLENLKTTLEGMGMGSHVPMQSNKVLQAASTGFDEVGQKSKIEELAELEKQGRELSAKHVEDKAALEAKLQTKNREEDHTRKLRDIDDEAKRERYWNREIIADKLKGDLNRIDSAGRMESEKNRTQLATAMLGSKSGIDRMRAIGDYQTSEQYNTASTAMQRRHKLEMEALLNRPGLTTEADKMRLEDKQAEERGRLDNQKSIVDAIRSSLGDVGSVRSLGSSNTGSTSSLVDAWKRAEQSSFGHVRDKTADAVVNMDRNAGLFHANLMGYLVDKLPGLLNAQQGAQVSMVQQYISQDSGLA